MSVQTNGNRSDANACFVCGVAVGDRWFGRVNQMNGRILLCSPDCGILFAEAPAPKSELADHVQYYRNQDQLIRAAKSVSGDLYSYDARMGNAAY